MKLIVNHPVSKKLNQELESMFYDSCKGGMIYYAIISKIKEPLRRQILFQLDNPIITSY